MNNNKNYKIKISSLVFEPAWLCEFFTAHSIKNKKTEQNKTEQKTKQRTKQNRIKTKQNKTKQTKKQNSNEGKQFILCPFLEPYLPFESNFKLHSNFNLYLNF